MLGNELGYPADFFLDKEQRAYMKFFNQLLHSIKILDPHHPVSTSIASIEKKSIRNLERKIPELDFISFYIFAQIYRMTEEIDNLRLFWDGPFLISEWGIEGPWADPKTAWKAPIEKSDT